MNLDCFCLVKYTSAGHNHIQSIRLVNYTSSIPSKYASMSKSYFKKQNKIKSTQKGDNDCRMSRGDGYEPKDQIDRSPRKRAAGAMRRPRTGRGISQPENAKRAKGFVHLYSLFPFFWFQRGIDSG